mmetsp:Transcript_16561/g.43360  ORF Transcript_16561/g.43360 Transcript_16561/m.43360 type:complete len:261 (+) Transcript_16561:146-928(+)
MAAAPCDHELTETTDARGAAFDPLGITTKPPLKSASAAGVRLSPALILAALTISEPAVAATGDDIALKSAFAAYGHFLSFGIAGASLTAERLTIKPNMTPEEEDIMSIADSVYGVSGLGIVVTGYLRVTQYGKGWDFYAHEPIFWFKLFLLSVMGASSFFPTVKIIQRAVDKANGNPQPPMSEKLASRMTSIINAELLAIFSIPLFASLMARGVAFQEGMPWQLGAAPVVLALGGLGYKYVNEALTWEEDDVAEEVISGL